MLICSAFVAGYIGRSETTSIFTCCSRLAWAANCGLYCGRGKHMIFLCSCWYAVSYDTTVNSLTWFAILCASM